MDRPDLDLLCEIFGSDNVIVFGEEKMEGLVVKAFADKRFGFIRAGDKKEYFFHQSDFNGHWDDLVQDIDSGRQIQVTFDIVPSPKGPRGSGVTRIDGGV
jgi:cold shock CspA family protein